MEPLDYCSNFLIGGYNSDGSTRLYSLVEEDELLASIRGRIMKKIALINPPFRGVIHRIKDAYPLGLGYIKAYCESKGVVCDLYDFSCSLLSDQALEEKYCLSDYDVIGVSSYSLFFSDTVVLIELLKKDRNIIVVGGHHATLCGSKILRDFPVIDFCLKGFGEKSFYDFISNIDTENVYSVSGLCYRKGDEFIDNPVNYEGIDINEFPVPDRGDIIVDASNYEFDATKRVFHISTSRGCPYHCTYCVNCKNNYWLARSELNVLEELNREFRGSGGNHVSVSPQEFVRCGADYAIVGEGEEAIEKIIQHEFGHYEESLDDCVNICTKNNVERSGFEPKVCVHGSDIPAPDWSIFDLTKYNENIHINKSRQALPVMASRGCPFKCDFCSTHLTWTTKVRYRNPIDVFNEIKNNQIKWGISDYHFYDDNLMINPEWVDQFTELIISTGLKINWICLSRPEIILKHKDLLPKMKSAGCKGFELGFETDDDGLYLAMNKKNIKSTFRKAYEYLCGVNFEMVEFLVMSFYVGETLQSLFRTNEALRQYKKQKALFVSSRYFATPFKGTPYYNSAMESGIDLYPGNEHRYAIFLNYMPNSFLESDLRGYTISESGLRLQFDLFGIENLMHSNEIERIMQHIPLEYFAQIFNSHSNAGKKVLDLCMHIQSLLPGIDILPVYEYVGRLIEFCASRGIMKNGGPLNEDSLL